MARIGFGAFLIIALFIGSQLFFKPEDTLVARLGAMLGEFESQWMDARTEALARQVGEVKEATAQVERLTLAYQKALEAEANIANRQIASINKTQWAKELGSGISDAICGLVLAGQALEPSADPLLVFCKLGDVARTAIVEDYAQALKSGRSGIPGDLLRVLEMFNQGGQR